MAFVSEYSKFKDFVSNEQTGKTMKFESLSDGSYCDEML
jgi:hypothetical protein